METIRTQFEKLANQLSRASEHSEELAADLEQSQRDRKKLEAVIREQQQQNSRALAVIASIESEKNAAESQLATFRKQVGELQARLEQRDKEERQDKAQLAVPNGDDDVESVHSWAHSSNGSQADDRAAALIEQHSARAAELEKKLAAAHTRVQQMMRSWNALRAEKEQLQEVHAQEMSELHQLYVDTVEKLRMSESELHMLVEHMNKKLPHVLAEVASLKKQLRVVYSERDALALEKLSLDKRLREQEAQLAEVGDKVTRMSEVCKKQVSVALKSRDDMRKQWTAACQRVKELNDVAERRWGDLQRHHEENEQLRSQTHELERQLRDATRELEKCDEAEANMIAKNLRMEKRLAEVIAELIGTRNQVSELAAQVQEMQQQQHHQHQEQQRSHSHSHRHHKAKKTNHKTSKSRKQRRRSPERRANHAPTSPMPFWHS
eukprot:TRINITY_DN66583_c9_g3_i1.p1 TRINITY_DN66583_c9_g3~~TRINITY_DN66583_c9_g3_i1.p1  ORF type:complete len:469 (+),score=264.03 TRINITY_DN66583_c9_g3_i1:99-1409(+)